MSEQQLCGNRFKLRNKTYYHPFLCELPKGHDGEHEAECDNAFFHQRWSDENGERAAERSKR